MILSIMYTEDSESPPLVQAQLSKAGPHLGGTEPKIRAVKLTESVYVHLSEPVFSSAK